MRPGLRQRAGGGQRVIAAGTDRSDPAPTAVVLIIDNSMSSGLVVGEMRVLNELKDLAGQTLSYVFQRFGTSQIPVGEEV